MVESNNEIQCVVDSMEIYVAVLWSVFGQGGKCRGRKMQKKPWRTLGVVLDSSNEMPGVVDSVGVT